MNSFFNKILKGDTTLWIIFITLCMASIPLMFSASSTLAYKAVNHSTPMFHHARFLILGFLLAVGIHYIPYRYIRIFSYLGLLVSFFLLIYVQINGVSENEATRWVDLLGFRFQPSEIAKLSLLIVVADFITRAKNNPEKEKNYFWIIMGLTGLICLLIFFDNFSTALLLALVVFILLFIGGISIKRLLLVAGVLVVLTVLGFFAVKAIPFESMPTKINRAHTWVNRIERFASSKEDATKFVITDETLQQKRSFIAIANGSYGGVGMGNSEQRDYLPQAYSDFIFAVFIEEFGLWGAVILIFFYLFLLFRAGQITTKCDYPFPAFLVIGLTLMIVVQALISMAVVTGIGPVTGQPLPLMSRGGTSIVITCVYFGIILGVTRQLKEEKQKKRSEEAEENEVPVVELEDL